MRPSEAPAGGAPREAVVDARGLRAGRAPKDISRVCALQLGTGSPRPFPHRVGEAC